METLYIFIIVLISLGISMLLTARDMDKDLSYTTRLSNFQLVSIFTFRWVVFTLYLSFLLLLIQSIYE